MEGRKKFLVGLAGIFAVTVILPVYFLVTQLKEDKIVRDYLAAHNLETLPLTKASAVSVAKQVSSDFNVRPETFQVLNMGDRPFLREDVGFLLTYKEGLCGEGARVIIRLLNAKGFDATRVTLYDRYMQFAHTVVSVQLNSNHFWIDTINSTDSLTHLMERTDISEDNFRYLTYSEQMSDRLEKLEEHYKVDETEEFTKNMGHYFLYSFEALPVTKLLSKVGIEKRVFNLRRPPRFISVLAEKPNMIKFWIGLAGSVGFTILCARPLRRFLGSK